MESWRLVFRDGFAPVLPTEGLEALAEALRTDDMKLIQGATTSPPPLMSVSDWPVEASCPVGYCGWKGLGLATVGEVEEFFRRCCAEADQRLGEPAACRFFLNAWDDSSRGEFFAEMLQEVELELSRRKVDAKIEAA